MQAAYRQIPVARDHQRVHVVCLWHPGRSDWVFADLYGLAFGLNQGLLTPRLEYLTVVSKAWGFLSTVSLQENGVVGFCQPGGGSPENNYNRTSTTSFCVGDFLLAASEISKVVEFQSLHASTNTSSRQLKSDDSSDQAAVPLPRTGSSV